MNDFDLNGVLAGITDLVAAWGLKVLGAIVVLLVGRMAAGWIRRGVRRALQRSRMDDTLIPFLSSLTYYTVLAFVLIAVLGMVGIQTASMIAVLGAAGLAVGLALQGTLANFAAGVMLLLFRPFKNGDYIDAGGTAGTVKAIGIFTTKLNTPDNVAIILPNGRVWGDTIKNYTTNPTRRLDMVIGIGYGDDIQTAIETIERVLRADGRVLNDPAPFVAVNELADSSVNLALRPWCNRGDYGQLRCDLMRTLKEELERAGCSIPFPQRDIHLFQDAAPAA